MEQNQTSKEISSGISFLTPCFFEIMIRQYAIKRRHPLTTSLIQRFFLQNYIWQTVQNRTMNYTSLPVVNQERSLTDQPLLGFVSEQSNAYFKKNASKSVSFIAWP